MKALFDTSVLVSVFLGDHEHHEASFTTFVRLASREAACSAHSLAEVYAALTRLPGRHRVPPEQAMLFLENIRERLTIVALTGPEYAAALASAASLGIVGGAVYDALIAQCAVKAEADVLYTWNVRDFRRLGPAVADRVRTP